MLNISVHENLKVSDGGVRVSAEAGEFILLHKLFKSDKTNNIIKSQFLRLSYPSRWYYDVLRSLDYFRNSKFNYDERMSDAVDIVLKKRGKNKRWNLQSNHKGQTHFEMEKVGAPSRWNTLRALRVLKYFEVIF
ncbi:MAG: hypothetical protein K8H86_03540 [Ignavibacteriaceae bacterium]|nr:hypothetical protein [Ignavibacteriaceae bacterium]